MVPPSDPAAYKLLSRENIEDQTLALTFSQIERGKHPDYVAEVSKKQVMSDDTLGATSGKYDDERDAFKREEIKERVVREMRRDIAEARKIEWIAVKHYDKRHPDAPESTDARGRYITSTGFGQLLESYDMQKKSFKMKNCYPIASDASRHMPNRNVGEALWTSVPGKEMPELCEIRVENPAFAKKIEAARVAKNLGYLSLRYYMHVPAGDVLPNHAISPTLLVEPVLLEFDLADIGDAANEDTKVAPILTYRISRNPDGTWSENVAPPSLQPRQEENPPTPARK